MPRLIELLAQHDWPGNVRELHHTLERAYLIGGGKRPPSSCRRDGQSQTAPRFLPSAVLKSG